MNKKITYYLSKTQWCLLLISGLLLQPLMAQVTFPYHQDLTTQLDSTEIRLFNDASWNENGILLTPAENSKFGAAILEGATFASNEGLKIEFEFGMYGSSEEQGADGISFFLFDADAYDDNNFDIGTDGEGLAYMYNRANNWNVDKRKPGLSGAYLGIGFDAWGKFHEGSFNMEKRKNGVLQALTTHRNQVTLRGAAGKTDLDTYGREKGYNGYPVLITRSTKLGDRARAVLNPNGGYDYSDNDDYDFDLSTPALGESPDDVNYRKAIILLEPNTSGGYNVTVKIQHSGNTEPTTIINKYHYKESFTYTENANSRGVLLGIATGSDYNLLNIHRPNTTHTLDATPPTEFKIGFGASTGSYTNNHLIRNLRVEILNAAVAEDDFASVVCEESVEIAVLENDYAYEGIPVVANSEYIDKTKFNFIAENGNVYTSSYIQDGVGVWSYDSDTGLVTFTKAEGFEGEASIQYSIIGRTSPYDGDDYRSLPATITVNVEHCVCTVEGNTSVPALVASTGITTLNRNSNTWLEDVNQGVNLVLESITKPFVITRVENVEQDIETPVEGMLVWETSTSSLKLYKASGWSTLREGCNKPVLRTNQ